MSSQAQEAVQEWVENAKNYYRSAGKRMALAEFSDPNGMFVRGEMYIYVLDLQGTMLAHGVNTKFVGEDFMHVTDAEGKAFIQEIVETAEMEESSWVDYKWYNPVTKQWNSKDVYF
jgi:cytochrome c